MAKKSFIENLNPAMQFISTAPQEPAREPDQQEPTPSRPHFEAKSRRLQLLIAPSLHEKLKAKVEAGEAKSVNDLVNSILEKALRKD